MGLTDMLITARTGHKTFEAHPLMTDVAFDEMNVAQHLATFFTLCRTLSAKMFPAFATSQQVFYTIRVMT